MLHLSSPRVDDLLGARGISEAGRTDPRSLSLDAWLEKQEAIHQFILFETDLEFSPWTRRVMNRADHIIWVAPAGGPCEPGPIELAFQDKRKKEALVDQTLVLFHETGQRPEKTRDWLANRTVSRHHHICPEKKGDMERLARFITDSAVGLVLGGGGAKGLAHIGVIQAMQEAGIPIDIVGGTSFGAIISAQYAMGWDINTIIEKNRAAWIQTRPLNDYTLPVYSLLSGNRVNRNSRNVFGAQTIEDLPINFFCVSSNLTQACPLIHQTGLLWKALRASGSLPGIFRPWLKDSDLLVDGAVLNNLPGDIMKRINHGELIAVDVSLSDNMAVTPQVISPWRTALQKISPFANTSGDPTILDILVRSTMLASLYKKEQVKKEADLYFCPPVHEFGFFEFKSMEAIIQAGYAYAKSELQKLDRQDLKAFQRPV